MRLNGPTSTVNLSHACHYKLLLSLHARIRFHYPPNEPPMLNPVPSARLLRILGASIDEKKLVCSFCRLQRPRKTSKSKYSTRIAPTTSINPQKNIPPEYKDLYERLDVFGRTASVYVNISQLRLALKNLETKHGVTRIAGRMGTKLHVQFWLMILQYLESMIGLDHCN